MGNEGSRPARSTPSPDEPDEEFFDAREDAEPPDKPPPSAGHLHEEFLHKGVDAEEAWDKAFADDPEAREGIKNIVAQLQGNVAYDHDPSAPKERARAESRAAEAKEAQARAQQAATDAADQEAEDWLAAQLRAGAAGAPEPGARRGTPPEPREAPPLAPQESRSLPAPEPPPAQSPPPPGPTPPEFYALLGVETDATYEEIRRGYRQQALKWHPDKNRDKLESATERFKRINEAFDTLFDPQKREMYDAGEVKERKAKRLQGHGWTNFADEDDEVLTKAAWKFKRGSWNAYVFMKGRIDDVDPIVDDPVNDPRVPQEKIKVFWRYVGQRAHDAREARAAERPEWLEDFVAEVWKDTPARWPAAQELAGMSEVARVEWKERRMVFSRRRQKVLLHIELHEDYLAIPDRLAKEEERLKAMNVIT